MENHSNPFLHPKPKYEANSTLQECAAIIKSQLQSDLLYWIIKRAVKGELIKKEYKLEDVKDLIPKILSKNNLQVKIENLIYLKHQQSLQHLRIQNLIRDELDVIQHANSLWTSFLKDQITSISRQLNFPLKRLRQEGQKKEENLPKFTGVYSCQKLLDIIINIQDTNHEMTFSSIICWNSIKLELKTLSFQELRIIFKELNPMEKQIGLDDIKEGFKLEAINLGKKLSNEGYISQLRNYAKNGIPINLRPKIYKQILNINSNKYYYEYLLKKYKEYELLIDDMIYYDVKRTCDDDNYFVFEDEILEIMKAFSRDGSIYHQLILKPITLYGINGDGQICGVYPTNGIIPFEGLSFFLAPLCYISNRNEEIYFIFREFFTKYFYKLHILSSNSQTIISLCKLFENLLQEHEPQLFYHLLELKIHPLKIAFNWIFFAFAGYLNVDQVLLLWDRILGFDNLYLIPILAAAIFSFRSEFLLKASNEQEIFDVFSDFTEIKCIPLLQLFLFH